MEKIRETESAAIKAVEQLEGSARALMAEAIKDAKFDRIDPRMAMLSAELINCFAVVKELVLTEASELDTIEERSFRIENKLDSMVELLRKQEECRMEDQKTIRKLQRELDSCKPAADVAKKKSPLDKYDPEDLY